MVGVVGGLVANTVAQNLVRNGSNFLVSMPGCPTAQLRGPLPAVVSVNASLWSGATRRPRCQPQPQRAPQRELMPPQGTEPQIAKVSQTLAHEEATSLSQL